MTRAATAKSRAPRGYSLNLVMILSALLVVLLATMLFVLSGSAQSSGGLIARKQTFFATDGMMRAVVKVSNDFLRRNPAADSAALQAAFDATTLNSITPTGYNREDFNITTTGRQVGIVPNGAFQGMNATLFPISARLKLRKLGSLAASRQDMSATIAQIGMFQFMVFIDGNGDWIPGPPQDVNGRVHANGDICLASNADFCLSKVTASGRIRDADNAACPFNPGQGNALIARDSTPDLSTCDGTVGADPAEWAPLTSGTRDSGCTNCAGSGAAWSTWARTEFGNNALDVDMAVPRLLLPVTGTRQAQAGKKANNTLATNGDNSRFLVDPVRGVDTADIRSQKYAEKADIRIIDGVWYIKGPPNTPWPGIAIWSDHPGRYTITSTASPAEHALVGGRAVGQQDIRNDWAARGAAWAALPPRLYSYYETDPASAGSPFRMLDTAATALGVVSYGTLARVAGPPVSWVPGHWPPSTNGHNDLCPTGSNYSVTGFLPFNSTATPCSGGNRVPPEVALLNATRSGFRDGHVQENGAAFAGATTNDGAVGGPAKHQKVLPMNFDVATFRQALATTTPGELGSYFCNIGGPCFMGRPFNGIVWMTSTWGDTATGSLRGFAGGTSGTNPGLWPAQGSAQNMNVPPAGDIKQPRERTQSNVASGTNGDSTTAQNALPYPLCSSPSGVGGASTAAGDVGGQRASSTTTNGSPPNGQFLWPNCDDTSFAAGLGARPMAIRVHNGGAIATDVDVNGANDDVRGANAGDIPDGVLDGMSLTTNLPLYVLGEWNVRDVTGAAINTTTSLATPWLPAMVGADQVYLLSNNWSDGGAPWDVDHNADARAIAGPTTYNIAILAGWAESAAGQYSGGIENFVRFIENWNGVNNNINGSLVVGFNSPYYRWPRFCCGPMTYSPPNRNWAYDTHLDTIANQPPGTPEYNVYATRAWTRR